MCDYVHAVYRYRCVILQCTCVYTCTCVCVHHVHVHLQCSIITHTKMYIHFPSPPPLSLSPSSLLQCECRSTGTSQETSRQTLSPQAAKLYKPLSDIFPSSIFSSSFVCSQSQRTTRKHFGAEKKNNPTNGGRTKRYELENERRQKHQRFEKIRRIFNGSGTFTRIGKKIGAESHYH